MRSFIVLFLFFASCKNHKMRVLAVESQKNETALRNETNLINVDGQPVNVWKDKSIDFDQDLSLELTESSDSNAHYQLKFKNQIDLSSIESSSLKLNYAQDGLEVAWDAPKFSSDPRLYAKVIFCQEQSCSTIYSKPKGFFWFTYPDSWNPSMEAQGTLSFCLASLNQGEDQCNSSKTTLWEPKLYPIKFPKEAQEIERLKGEIFLKALSLYEILDWKKDSLFFGKIPLSIAFKETNYEEFSLILEDIKQNSSESSSPSLSLAQDQNQKSKGDKQNTTKTLGIASATLLGAAFLAHRKASQKNSEFKNSYSRLNYNSNPIVQDYVSWKGVSGFLAIVGAGLGAGAVASALKLNEESGQEIIDEIFVLMKERDKKIVTLENQIQTDIAQ